ncbi:MAG: hypothetical protein PHC60_07485 [Heliobacteriaceae bacterium]|nr:hypothetical protein [Heliobacteriaceae bacterium]
MVKRMFVFVFTTIFLLTFAGAGLAQEPTPTDRGISEGLFITGEFYSKAHIFEMTLAEKVTLSNAADIDDNAIYAMPIGNAMHFVYYNKYSGLTSLRPLSEQNPLEGKIFIDKATGSRFTARLNPASPPNQDREPLTDEKETIGVVLDKNSVRFSFPNEIKFPISAKDFINTGSEDGLKIYAVQVDPADRKTITLTTSDQEAGKYYYRYLEYGQGNYYLLRAQGYAPPEPSKVIEEGLWGSYSDPDTKKTISLPSHQWADYLGREVTWAVDPTDFVVKYGYCSLGNVELLSDKKTLVFTLSWYSEDKPMAYIIDWQPPGMNVTYRFRSSLAQDIEIK